MAVKLDELQLTKKLTLPIGSDAYTNASLFFGAKSKIGTSTSNTFGIYSTGNIIFRPNNGTLGYSEGLELSPAALIPTKNNTVTLGNSTHKWNNVYATTFTGALSGNATSATKATQDDDGNVIKNTYLKLSGGVLTGTVQWRDGTNNTNYISATVNTVGTTTETGIARITLGNSTAAGVVGNARGRFSIYGDGPYCIHLQTHSANLTASRYYNFQDHGRNVYSVGMPVTQSAVGSETEPVYVNNKGVVTACGASLAANAASASRLISFNAFPSASGVQYCAGSVTKGTNPGQAFEGTSPGWAIWSYPPGETWTTDEVANVQTLRLFWDNTYFTDIYTSPNTPKLWTRAVQNGTAGAWRQIWTAGDLITGAVWNDYAEYRRAETIEPGRVVQESKDGIMKITTERMVGGCEIISDTFGFAIGETDECKTPIAATGRVLAYPYEDRDTFELGQAVCAGPGGTVSRMSRNEIIHFPDRIIGTVSEIPDYETWGTGNVKVNGRIWIRIR